MGTILQRSFYILLRINSPFKPLLYLNGYNTPKRYNNGIEGLKIRFIHLILIVMTKKTFQLVADALKALAEQQTIDTPREARAFLTGYFSNAFINENPKFNKDKFLKACGM